MIADMLIFVQKKQRLLHEMLGHDLRQAAGEHGLAASIGVLIVSFLYGLFHAVGPGHGKVLLTGYLLAGRHTIKRGVWVAGLSALLQALTAIVLVIGLYYLIGVARGKTEAAAQYLELIGYGFMVAVGAWLLVRGLREAWGLIKGGHHHHEGTCTHHHAPVLTGKESRRSIALMVLSMGIRPCSGALIVLMFACIVGAVWVGILASLIMALGTFLATAGMASIALWSKKGLLRVFHSSERKLEAVHAGIAILGGCAIMVLAGMLLAAQISSITAPIEHPLHFKG
jgi:nickel/cobalt exporter